MASYREKDQLGALERQLASEDPELAKSLRAWREPRHRLNRRWLWHSAILLAAAMTAVALLLGQSQTALILAVGTTELVCLRVLYGPLSAERSTRRRHP